MDRKEAEERVDRGVEFLSTHEEVPANWPHLIDTIDLNMALSNKCVLGKLDAALTGDYGSFWHCAIHLGLRGSSPDTHDVQRVTELGFFAPEEDEDDHTRLGSANYDILTDVWRCRLERLQATTDNI